MKTITLNIPDSVELDEKDTTILVAAILFEKGKLTMGQAAKMVNLSKKTFMELLSKYGVSIFNYPASDLENDIKNARNYSI